MKKTRRYKIFDLDIVKDTGSNTQTFYCGPELVATKVYFNRQFRLFATTSVNATISLYESIDGTIFKKSDESSVTSDGFFYTFNITGDYFYFKITPAANGKLNLLMTGVDNEN